MGISTAVPSEDVSRTSGYQLNKGNFSTVQPYLPQQVVILAEANTANQSSIVTTPVQITTAAQAGRIYGYGSPIHAAARIFFPNSGNGIGGIPVYVMAQLAAAGATATVITIDIAGTATKSKTHYLNIAGREVLDASNYAANIIVGDTPDLIAAKYFNAVNNVLSSPVICTKTTSAGTHTTSTAVFNAASLTGGQGVGMGGLVFTCFYAMSSSVVFNATPLSAGQTVTLGGLTYTSTGATTTAQLAAAFASLANGATTGAGTGTGTYSGTLTGFSSGTVASGTTVVFLAVNKSSPTGITFTGTGAAPTITSTSTGSVTQAQLANAFQTLADGATTGGGTTLGTYSGALTGFSSSFVTSGSTVIFTATPLGSGAGITPTTINGAAAPAITTVFGTLQSGSITLTTKWTGLTAADLTAVPDVAGDSVGITYAITSTTPGTGTPSIATALTQFERWYTLVLNSYGVPQLAALEAFNGHPDNVNPTGNYSPLSFKPFMAFFGSTDPVAADLVAITDAAARIPEVTNVLCPAPASGGMPYEAAANMLLLFANIAQSQPHSTVAGQSYTDMPVPASNLIGDLSVYANRNLLKTKGCSTVSLKNAAYKVQDLVTTYHPDGEVPLVFNECRYLVIDWNIKYGYGILEDVNLKDKTIIEDGQYTTVQNVISPSGWKAILFTYFDSLAILGLITDAAFSKASLAVQIDPTNPNRFNSTFSYKRTGTAEIESTTVTVGF